MTTVRLNPLDAAWLFTESRATPNHVGGLLQFRLPEGAPRDFLRQLMAEFRSHRDFKPPWNRRLKLPINKNPVHAWVEDDEIDLEYHVRHAALPWPGGERELGELWAGCRARRWTWCARPGSARSSKGWTTTASHCSSRCTIR